MKKGMKIALTVFLSAAAACCITAGAALAILNVRTAALDDDYSGIYADERYAVPVLAEGTELVEQDISCGYAVIEMFAQWAGRDVTEESLYEEYGKVVTSTGKSFCREMNRQFPEYRTSMHSYLPASEMIEAAYESLESGIPVPFEWAAELDGTWTLHYSLLVGMDIPGDRITVLNPYGYQEVLSVRDFLSRTSFEAFENMPLFLQLGFAFGFFEKNTLFTAASA